MKMTKTEDLMTEDLKLLRVKLRQLICSHDADVALKAASMLMHLMTDKKFYPR